MSESANAVTAFIEKRVQPEYRPIVAAFRHLVQRHFPELKEEMRGGTEKYYGVPAYRNKRIIVVISPTKQGITFGFSNGAKFKDKYKKLEGVGNKSLNVRLQHLEEFDEEIMRYYIAQGIEVDNQL